MSASASNVIPFPSSDDNVVADLLLMLEKAPACARIDVAVVSGRWPVHLCLDERVVMLTVAQARTAADCLWHENAFPGCLGVSAALHDAALRAQIGAPPEPVPATVILPTPGRTASRTMAVFAAGLAFGLILPAVLWVVG